MVDSEERVAAELILSLSSESIWRWDTRCEEAGARY